MPGPSATMAWTSGSCRSRHRRAASRSGRHSPFGWPRHSTTGLTLAAWFQKGMASAGSDWWPWRAALIRSHCGTACGPERPLSEVQDELRGLSESIDSRSQHPATLYCLARTLRRVKQSASALRILRDAQYVYPEDFWLNFELAFTLSEQKDHEGAIRFYAAAVAISPNSAAAHNNLGNALSRRKKLNEAVACFQKAIELAPKFAGTHNNLGLALRGQNKL